MELLVITTLSVGVWMNWSFAFNSKPKWINLYALRKLVGFQLTTNLFNIAVHLFLLIPWPFWGYAINPGNFLWTIDPVACRLITAVEDLISISCAANATAIFVTDPEKQELKQERKRKMAFCLVLVTFCLGGVCSIVYRGLIPLVVYGTLSGSNCPSNSLTLLCTQNGFKYAFASYATCSFILFWSVHHKRYSHLSNSMVGNIIASLSTYLSSTHHCITMCALVFAVTCTPIYIFGGSLYSVDFNIVKLYFDITALALSIGLPTLLAQIHDNEVVTYSLESTLVERRAETGPKRIK